MLHRQRCLAKALCLLAGMLFAALAFAADADVTGLVPTIWWDFETKPDAAGLTTANKGSASISFTSEGTKTYQQSTVTNGWALDTSKFTPYSAANGTFTSVGRAFTVSAVMTLGTTQNGVSLNVANESANMDIVIRRGATAGSLVIGLGPHKKNSTTLMNTTVANGDSTYHLVSVVSEQSGTSLYVDGDLVASTNVTSWSDSGRASRMQFGSHLGGASSNNDVKGGGCIDDLRIHDAALTTGQMKAIAAEYGLIVVADALTVSGAPQNWGTVVPSYGITNGLSQGDIVACSAIGFETAATKTFPVGYSLYSVSADGTKTLVEESDATSLSYTQGSAPGLLIWHWAQSNFVAVVAGTNGSVTAGGWAGYGDSFAATATPDPGCKFYRWTGDTAGIDIQSASIVVPSVTAPLSLAAEFLDESVDETVQWVSPSGNDENDGYFKASPKKTIAAASAWLAPVAQSKACTVHVAPGLYMISSPIVVTNAISVLGDDPDPSCVIVSNRHQAGWAQNYRVFEINHADALVANLTMQHGSVGGDWTEGANFCIGSAGGTVSNCVVEAGEQRTNHANGGGGSLGAGLVTHTVFRKNKAPDSSPYSPGGGNRAAVLHLYGSSRAENCLLVDNPQSKAVVLVRLTESAVMRNCTIVDSGIAKTNEHCTTFSAIRIDGSKASVINTVIAGVTNKIDGAACPPTGHVENFLNCAYDGDVTGLPEGTVAGTAAEFFKKYEEGDYRPMPGGVLVNKGQNYVPMAAKDLGGNRRLIGRAVDIGCYEANAAKFYIRVR